MFHDSRKEINQSYIILIIFFEKLFRLQVVGHSQGMSALYVMLSAFPNMAEDISLVGFLIFNSWKLLFDKNILVFKKS